MQAVSRSSRQSLLKGGRFVRKMVMLVVAVMLCALASGAQAALFQDDFNNAPWTQANWQIYNTLYGQTFTFVDDGGNQVMQVAAAQLGPPATKTAGIFCANGQTYFVDNMTIQVDINLPSGCGGGLFWGYEGANKNQYSLGLVPAAFPDPPYGAIGIGEDPGDGSDTPLCLERLPLAYNTWYTVKVVSTGTNFEVWFNERGQPLVKIFDVPQDQLHPGYQSHVRGQCGVFADVYWPGGPGTVWVDNFVFDALETPPEQVFQDDFQDSTWTLDNWVQLNNPTVTFESPAGNQALKLTQPIHDTVGLLAAKGKMYFADAFTLTHAAYVDAKFNGGIAYGLNLTGPTPWLLSGYIAGMNRAGDNILVGLVEKVNLVETFLATATVPGSPGVYWYNCEVFAGVTGLTGEARFKVWVWPRGDPKPATPVIDVRQDVLHPGYRLSNLGTVGIWNHQIWWQWPPPLDGLFDDFYLQATPVPATNTPEGSDVTIDAGEGVGLTFDNVATGGATQVETSTAGPGPGPGNFELAPEGGAGLYYDINTSCTFTGNIDICISYDDTGMTPEQEASLRLWHWDTLLVPPAWVDVTTSVDTVNNKVCGQVSHLSVFALGAAPRFEGFFQPINMPPQAMSVFKAGSTIPVKFRLRTFFTQQIIDNATATIGLEYLGSDSAAAQVNELFIQALEDSGNAFRYDAADHQYIFNLKTRGLSPGIYRIHALIYGGLLDEWVDVRLR
jgi:hypothetical protein